MSKLSSCVPTRLPLRRRSTPAQSASRFSDGEEDWAVFHGHGFETQVSLKHLEPRFVEPLKAKFRG